MVDERVRIVVEEDGTRVVQRRMDDLGNSAKRAGAAVKQPTEQLKRHSAQAKQTAVAQQQLTGSTNLLRRAFLALGGSLLLRETVRMVDTYTNLQNRLRLVTTGTQDLANVTQELFEISNRTRTSYEGTAELFARVAISGKELGVTNQQLLQFTESLNQAIILSGASAQEAAAGVIQLSQGLASGALRGDELRAVLEQLPAVADIVAKELGVTRGQLRALGQDGKITADIVLRAFANAREELEDRFATTLPTIGQAWTVLRNNVLDYVGAGDQATGVSRLVAGSIITLANNVDVLAGAMAGLALTQIPRATAALQSLWVVIVSNPIGALAVVIGAAIGGFIQMTSQIDIYKTTVDQSNSATLELSESINLFTASTNSAADAQERFNLALEQGNAAKASSALTSQSTALENELINLRRQFDFSRQSEEILKARKEFIDLNNQFFIPTGPSDTVHSLSAGLLRYGGDSLDFIRQFNLESQELGGAFDRHVNGQFIHAEELIERVELRVQSLNSRAEELRNTGLGLADATDDQNKKNSSLSASWKVLRDTFGPVIGNLIEGTGRMSESSSAVNQLADDTKILTQAQIELAEAQARQAEASKRSLDALQSLQERQFNASETLDVLRGGGTLEGAQAELARRQSRQVFLDNLENANLPSDVSAQRLKAFDTELARVEQTENAVQALNKALEENERRAQQLTNTLESGFTDAFAGIIAGTKSVEDAFRSLAESVLQLFIRQQVAAPLASALTSSTGGFFNGLFGVQSPAQVVAGVDGARALGGPVNAGRSYLVGERGPEIFVPHAGGMVVPNSAGDDQRRSGGAGNRPVVVNVTTPDADSFRRSSKQVAKETRRRLR